MMAREGAQVFKRIRIYWHTASLTNPEKAEKVASAAFGNLRDASALDALARALGQGELEIATAASALGARGPNHAIPRRPTCLPR